MHDDELFQEQMAGVTPLQREPRARLKRDTPISTEARRAAAQGSPKPVHPLVDEGVEPLDAWFVLDFKRPGIQNGVYRKLRQGRYEIEARLDLHRMTVREAREEAAAFIAEASQLGLRTVLILHGKGQRQSEVRETAVLKGYVNQWLQALDTVQAFHSAQAVHGGTGAVYVLLRKSVEKKRENRERFLKGRLAPDA